MPGLPRAEGTVPGLHMADDALPGLSQDTGSFASAHLGAERAGLGSSGEEGSCARASSGQQELCQGSMGHGSCAVAPPGQLAAVLGSPEDTLQRTLQCYQLPTHRPPGILSALLAAPGQEERPPPGRCEPVGARAGTHRRCAEAAAARRGPAAALGGHRQQVVADRKSVV